MENNTNGVQKPLSEQSILPVLVKAVLVRQTYRVFCLTKCSEEAKCEDRHTTLQTNTLKCVHQQLVLLLRTFTREFYWWRRESQIWCMQNEDISVYYISRLRAVFQEI